MKKPKTTIIIELKIRGTREDAFTVVDEVIDCGTLQDAINGHDVADAGKLRVLSAISRVPEKESRRSTRQRARIAEQIAALMFPGGDLEHACGADELGQIANLLKEGGLV
jgi:hypothetical protein